MESIDRVLLGNVKLVNAFGNPVFDHLNVNQQVQISAEITNNQEYSQPFVYIVQIKDQNNAIISLAWISGDLIAGQSFSPAISWRPYVSGTFSAEIFVWKSMVDPDALSNSVEIIIRSS